MTVEEIKEKRKQAEQDVRAILLNLEAETKCAVSGVDVDFMEMRDFGSGFHSRVERVRIEIKI